ncbi:MAG: hypothetical protein PHP34_08590 [Bacteroidales bacterium]|nr:hypothetical protein [Bacteroidales bacterium]
MPLQSQTSYAPSSALKGSGMADADFDGQVQWTRRVRQNKILKAQRDEIFVPESSGHKPGLAETEVMPLPERSGAHFAKYSTTL